jgi:hypothetical protein
MGFLNKKSWAKQLTLVFGLFGNDRFMRTKTLKNEDF